ncbi:MAG: hypothetical protein HY720_00270, partial [Planctomycetes bacterium]|nr:hypothetical protein [Planctomycetota bacterium]
LEALGLAALPAVRERLGSLAQGTPARARLEALASRLAVVIQKAWVEPGPVLPGESLRETIESVRGRPLTAEGFVDLVVRALEELPEGSPGIDLFAERPGDDTGVELRLRLLGGNLDEPAPTGGGVSVDVRVLVGEERVVAGRSFASRWTAPERSTNLEYYLSGLGKALASSPETRFEVLVELR